MTLRIAEIFRSLQGEAASAGWPTIFVRLAGCNLRCSYCDTAWAWDQGEPIEIDSVRTRIRSLGPTRHVCLTGGEPLLQREAVLSLAEALISEGHAVSMETNGSFPVEGLPDKLVAVIDIKTPASGMSGIMNFENVRLARRHHDLFKFVIAAQDDFAWALDFVARHHLSRRYEVYFSPAAPAVSPDWLAEAILASGLEIRLNLQLHKILWPADPRGR